jgi:hypothetical protein
VEAFFSQYHEPVIPYEVKIAFGAAEMALLILYLSRAGKGKEEPFDRLPSAKAA